MGLCGKVSVPKSVNIGLAVEVWAELKTFREQLIPDMRRFYNVSYFEVGRTVSLEEAYYLLQSLSNNTQSEYCVKKNEFKHQFTPTDQIMLDLLELTANANSKKRVKVPRPWEKTQQKLGSARGVAPSKVKQLLAAQAKLKQQRQQ